MQYDRDADGELTPLPQPSIDTGAGLERLASILQGVESNYDTDLFTPLIERAVEGSGVPYDHGPGGVSRRVLADHGRAGAIRLSSGFFPPPARNGCGLTSVLRRDDRHAPVLR